MKVKNMTVLASMVLFYSAQGMARQFDISAANIDVNTSKSSFILTGAGGAGAQVAQGVQEER